MNNATASVTSNPAAHFHAEFVNGAVRRLASAISSDAHAGETPGQAHGSLARALASVLSHFGCPVDEMSLALAARAEDPEVAIRRICEENDIHVRAIELGANESRTFAGPVLAFRGGEAVVLFPAVWRKWVEAGGEAAARGPLQPSAFTFYRSLKPEPLRTRELWSVLFGRENRLDLAYALLWGMAAAALSTISVYLMRSLVEWALPEGDSGGLALLASGWCVVAITASNLRLSRALLQTRIGTRLSVSIEAALVGRALSLPVSQFKGFGAGELSERIRDASQFAKAAFGIATDVVIAASTVLAYVAMLSSTSARAALVVSTVTLLRALVGAALLAGTYVDGKRHAAARGKMSALLFELLSGIARIKVASAEPRAFYRWATAFATVRRAAYRASLFSGMLTAVEGLFDVAGTIVLYAVCCGKASDPSLGVGSFVVAAASLGGLQAAYSDAMRGMIRLLPLMPAAARVRPLLAASGEVRPGAARTMLEGKVSLRNVTFHYADDDIRVLDNVSLDIERGQFVAIVGPSGCGKSTLIKMILGFYGPTSGSVLLDGKDLAGLDLRSVRRQIGAVLQGSELLPSSILFNIVGTTRKTIDDAWVAARAACIAEDIEQMPMKMFTVLSDRAVTISGGQKQRILIARALVRQPKLLIFDEATSALDNKTQAAVMQALGEMKCTKICIAHRLSTVVHADRIIVMDKGTIIQEGTFDSLMREEGLFRTLVQSQLESE